MAGAYLFFHLVIPHVGFGAQHKRRVKMGRYLSDSDIGCWKAGWWLVGAFEPGLYAHLGNLVPDDFVEQRSGAHVARRGAREGRSVLSSDLNATAGKRSNNGSAATSRPLPLPIAEPLSNQIKRRPVARPTAPGGSPRSV